MFIDCQLHQFFSFPENAWSIYFAIFFVRHSIIRFPFLKNGFAIATSVWKSSPYFVQGLLTFEKRWRRHFVDTMQPKHLPHLWSVDHNHDRVLQKASSWKRTHCVVSVGVKKGKSWYLALRKHWWLVLANTLMCSTKNSMKLLDKISASLCGYTSQRTFKLQTTSGWQFIEATWSAPYWGCRRWMLRHHKV